VTGLILISLSLGSNDLGKVTLAKIYIFGQRISTPTPRRAFRWVGAHGASPPPSPTFRSSNAWPMVSFRQASKTSNSTKQIVAEKTDAVEKVDGRGAQSDFGGDVLFTRQQSQIDRCCAHKSWIVLKTPFRAGKELPQAIREMNTAEFQRVTSKYLFRKRAFAFSTEFFNTIGSL